MDGNGAPCVRDAEVEGFRSNLEMCDAREDFYEPITHPFPPDTSATEGVKGGGEKEQHPEVTGDVPVQASVPSPPQSDAEEVPSDAEVNKSISQEIIEAAYRTAMEGASESLALAERRSSVAIDVDVDVTSDASTKSLFNSLITSPSRISSRTSRLESDDLGTGTEMSEVDELIGLSTSRRGVEATRQRPRYYSNRSTTLPAKLESKTFEQSKHSKLTRWEVFKRKFYLGVAHNLPPLRASEDADVGTSLDAATSRASTAGPIDVESFCEVTNIEGLDLEGIPPMTQRSRKLFSWTRLKTGFTLKRKQGGGGATKGSKSDEDGPKGEPDEAVKQAHNHIDDDDGTFSQLDEDEENATTSKTPTTPAKDKTHSWFEILSHRIFTATRRQRSVENAPVRPATAHATQQYYEIESNW